MIERPNELREYKVSRDDSGRCWEVWEQIISPAGDGRYEFAFNETIVLDEGLLFRGEDFSTFYTLEKVGTSREELDSRRRECDF